jgi:hypothetical protein
MGHTDRILDDARSQIAPADATLKTARSRREEVLSAARDFEGALRTYNSGSIGHGTANDDTDADCGLVLDRRSYPTLGPDGDGEGPEDIVQRVRAFTRDKLIEDHPTLSTRLTKRAIVFEFQEPLTDAENAPDPSVDLIVALTRKHADGLWIPNRHTSGWDASHPERHTELLTNPPADIRRVRARTVRLGKAWNKQFSEPGLSSFNVEALALECIDEVLTIGEALTRWFEYSADEVRKRDTEDPAGVSPPVRLLLDRETVANRLQSAGGHMRKAIDNDDDEGMVREELSKVFPDYIQKSYVSSSKAAIASAL